MAFPEKCQPPWPLKRARGIDESRKMGEIDQKGDFRPKALKSQLLLKLLDHAPEA